MSLLGVLLAVSSVLQDCTMISKRVRTVLARQKVYQNQTAKLLFSAICGRVVRHTFSFRHCSRLSSESVVTVWVFTSASDAVAIAEQIQTMCRKSFSRFSASARQCISLVEPCQDCIARSLFCHLTCQHRPSPDLCLISDAREEHEASFLFIV